MFSRIYVEISNICNLDCDFCHGTKRERRIMSAAEFAAIAPKVKKETDYVYLHLMGEPLIHPELYRIIDIAAENQLKVAITTNGTLLNRHAENLLSHADKLYKISISMHSFEANHKKSDSTDSRVEKSESATPERCAPAALDSAQRVSTAPENSAPNVPDFEEREPTALGSKKATPTAPENSATTAPDSELCESTALDSKKATPTAPENSAPNVPDFEEREPTALDSKKATSTAPENSAPNAPDSELREPTALGSKKAAPTAPENSAPNVPGFEEREPTAIDVEQYVTTALDFAKKAGERGIISVLRLWNLSSGTIKSAGKHARDGKSSATPAADAGIYAAKAAETDLKAAFSTELTEALSFVSEENRKILNLAKEYFPDEWKSGRQGLTLGKRVYLEWGERFDWPDISLDEITSSGENNAKNSKNGEHCGAKTAQNNTNCSASGESNTKSSACFGTSGETHVKSSACFGASGEADAQNSAKIACCGERNPQNNDKYTSCGECISQNTAKSASCGECIYQNGTNCAASGGNRAESRADLATSGENSTQNTVKFTSCGDHNAKNGINFGSSGANPVKSDAYHGFCYGMLDHIGILADGTVVPCCLDADGEIALGNIFECELSEILASPRARAIADGFKRHQKVEPLCRRCGYSKRFD